VGERLPEHIVHRASQVGRIRRAFRQECGRDRRVEPDVAGILMNRLRFGDAVGDEGLFEQVFIIKVREIPIPIPARDVHVERAAGLLPLIAH